jgi:hypothetical protein
VSAHLSGGRGRIDDYAIIDRPSTGVAIDNVAEEAGVIALAVGLRHGVAPFSSERRIAPPPLPGKKAFPGRVY